ncbi:MULTISPECIES: Sec-independent protein translocase subunit TatA [unclassified Streptomyces]|uniref:Sec-independent protein translocase subunit TatA n=1 Tax=unclassified Streptomyces TaxID=2593676 RepID=UPI0004BD5972|nr:MULTISPECIES: Sec-independent protein translocase subunit TatA [unclassified Streptomyces]PWK71860.1 sec-independent protein translocase protein TatA [Streptomyces sp. CG 926]
MLRNAFQPWHLVLVLVVCLLVFGSKRLPDMARSLGRSMRILKSEARALRSEDTP